ncbi:hypothetical protein F511_37706 [Dorcoceras hygrometricum]|uniref:Uncharacterized protein n=1 Tax=Dorcoceras hygrometricum TaxID=472368 RepID=A0A2Z7CYK5_9LAMI|nr:hypothetical protein F511_37706 [Dorcoceras hygrometricum]
MLNKKLTTANVTVKKAGSAMMTSAVMSSQPAGSLYIQTQERSDVVEEEIQSQATVHQQLWNGFSRSAKTKIQQMLFALITSSRKISAVDTTSFDLTSWTSSRKLYASSRKLCVSSRHGIQSQESRCSGELQSRHKIPVAVFEDSAEAQSSSRLESAAKQLTIYESWMSTAELSHTVAADVHLWSLGVLTAAGCGIGSVHEFAKAKRCRINLCKRHRFAIAISKYQLLVNISLRLDFLLYDVASLLRLDVQATCLL